MIKLIASDIDGTLVPDGTAKIDKRMFDIIKRLKRTEEMSVDDVSELFMLDMKDAEKVLEEPSKVRLVLETI